MLRKLKDVCSKRGPECRRRFNAIRHKIGSFNHPTETQVQWILHGGIDSFDKWYSREFGKEIALEKDINQWKETKRDVGKEAKRESERYARESERYARLQRVRKRFRELDAKEKAKLQELKELLPGIISTLKTRQEDLLRTEQRIRSLLKKDNCCEDLKDLKVSMEKESSSLHQKLDALLQKYEQFHKTMNS